MAGSFTGTIRRAGWMAGSSPTKLAGSNM